MSSGVRATRRDERVRRKCCEDEVKPRVSGRGKKKNKQGGRGDADAGISARQRGGFRGLLITPGLLPSSRLCSGWQAGESAAVVARTLVVACEQRGPNRGSLRMARSLGGLKGTLGRGSMFSSRCLFRIVFGSFVLWYAYNKL